VNDSLRNRSMRAASWCPSMRQLETKIRAIYLRQSNAAHHAPPRKIAGTSQASCRRSRACACSAATPRRGHAERATYITCASRRQLGNHTTPRSLDATGFSLARESARQPFIFVIRHKPPNAGITRRPERLSYMTFVVSAVGCMPLLASGLTL
jgi:hypothetical protein